MIRRRQFLEQTLLSAAASRALFAQAAAPAGEWGGPVIDIHLHQRQAGGELLHMEGCGVSNAVILSRAAADEQVKATMEKTPSRFVRFTSADVTRPDAIESMRKAIQAGAIGMGELKSRVAVDGPEMRRVYDLAAETGVPVLFHLQEVPQFEGDGTFNAGLARLPALLKAYPRVTFIGHADFFWANISAEVPFTSYPTGPVKPGGLTDKMLADYPNLYGDMSANSGRNALGRDTEFMAGFLARHQNKLMFGSDCSCRDGKGTGQGSQQPLIKGKCVARESLTALKQLASPQVFRKVTWENAVKLLKVKV